MIRTILIDDEAAALNALNKKLQMYCDGIEIISLCNNSKAGLKSIIELKPDLVFLDIEMPWMNGFELLSFIGDDINFRVVFVTAYDQYAIQAFKVRAIDYLLKPVDKDDLIDCVARVKNEYNNVSKDNIDTLIKEMQSPLNTSRIMIHSVDGIEVIESDNIIYCQAASNYTYIYTIDDRKIVASKTLSYLEKSLDENSFIRIHKSYNVNIKQIQKYSSLDGGELILKNNLRLPVSRRKKEDVLNAIAKL